MKTQITRALLCKTTLATVLAVAALFVSGCSTTPVAREGNEKSVSYAQLHGMMIKLVNETTQVGATGPVEVMITASDEAASSRTLAVNP